MKELGTLVDKLFPNSLNELRDMSTSKVGNKKRIVLVIPKFRMKKRVKSESSNVAAQIVVNLAQQIGGDQSLEVAQNIEVVIVVAKAIATQTMATSDLVDLTEKSSWEKRKDNKDLSGVFLPVVQSVQLKSRIIGSLLLRVNSSSSLYLKIIIK